MPRAGLTTARVVDAALELVDDDGLEGLTLTRLADAVGVKPPSLYKHVDGLAGLVELAAVAATDQLADALRDAAVGRSGDDAIAALAQAYRGWVLANPQRYALVPVAPPPVGTPLAAAGERIVAVVVAVLRSQDLDDDAAIHATRCLRAAVHGFTSLEAAGGFGLPVDLDQTFDALVAMVLAGVHDLAGT